MTEKYITQVSEEIEGRVTKNLSQQFSRTESRILGALSKLDEFLLNPQVRTHSGTVPGASQNNDSRNLQRIGDRSPNDPYPKVEFYVPQTWTSADSDREITSHMVTGVQEEIPYCCPGNSSGKQKKEHSTSQPKYRSENSPATTEADQILLAFQQLAANNNSTKFNNNTNRISKLAKSVTTTVSIFDGNLEKFEPFEDVFQTSLKNQNQLTEENKTNYFHSLRRGDALQTFRKITSLNREN